MLPRYSNLGPSSRLRFMQYIPALEAAGATVRCSSFFGTDYLRGYFESGRKSKAAALHAFARRTSALLRQRADLIWVEKEVFPFLPGAFEGLLRLKRARYVVDYDDATFHTYDQHASAAVRRVLGTKLDPLLAGAALVTAGNAYLERYARDHGARELERVPTVIDLDRYPVTERPAGDEVRIGWIGTPANARYLEPVVVALNRLANVHRLRLVTIGAPELPDFLIPQERHEWSEERESELLAGIDIGVMPLPDDAWERGKCGYKLIQYMAAGRPVIASPVGVNQEIVTEDVGLLASDPDEWERALVALINAPARRTQMGRAARQKVETHYSLQVTAPRLVERFARLLAN